MEEEANGNQRAYFSGLLLLPIQASLSAPSLMGLFGDLRVVTLSEWMHNIATQYHALVHTVVESIGLNRLVAVSPWEADLAVLTSLFSFAMATRTAAFVGEAEKYFALRQSRPSRSVGLRLAMLLYILVFLALPIGSLYADELGLHSTGGFGDLLLVTFPMLLFTFFLAGLHTRVKLRRERFQLGRQPRGLPMGAVFGQAFKTWVWDLRIIIGAAILIFAVVAFANWFEAV